MYTNKSKIHFTKGEMADAVRIWNSTAVSLLDIRHNLISPQEALQRYRLPASTFLFTSGGKASISLGDVPYHTERFGLFHGGKGTELTIQLECDWLEYYMVFYKTGEPAFHRGEYRHLLEKVNPFRQQYGFAPVNPIFFLNELRKMYEKWRGTAPLNLFYGKTAFYCFVYEIYEELEQGDIHVFEPDVIAMACQYLDKYYTQPIVIQEMSEMLGVSYSHFHRSFKRKTGKSPQEYLIQARLIAAKNLLRDSQISIREIANYCGFQDERNLQRMFSKNMGLTPSAYRENVSQHMRDDVLGKLIPFPYNSQGQVSFDELKEKGATSMFKQMRSKAVVAAALSLMMILSACGTAPADSGSINSASNSVVSSQTSEKEVSEPVKEGTKTISTVMGDVEIPLNPKRVIVHYLAGDAVALGVIPVAVSEVLPGAVFQEELKDSAELGQWDFDLEEVMSLEPDLIVSVNEGQYEDLSKIAPTVLVPYGTMTTEERVTFMGEIFSKPDEAKAALTKYEAAIADGKAKLAEAEFGEATVSAMQVSDSNISVAGDKHALGVILYKELGVKAPEIVQTSVIDANEYWGNPSMEVLSDYCGDYIFHLGEVPESVSSNAVWQSIPAVESGNVLIMNTSITYYTDISSSTAMVNNVVEQLLTAKNK